MQTDFSPDQLMDPMLARAEKNLRKCVHCGFCTATCPTYLLTGDELDGPRGRIYLMKDMLEQNRAADARTVRHVDRCLSCLSCRTTCPSGVDYLQLVDHARTHIEETYARPLPDRALRAVLSRVMISPPLFRTALRLAALARPFARLAPKRIRAMLTLATGVETVARDAFYPAHGQRKFRALLLVGCVQDSLDSAIHDATISLLTRHGVEVLAPYAGCCGSLEHHMGKRHRAAATAARAMAGWRTAVEMGGVDFIISDASGCAATLKHYQDLFADDDPAAATAQKVASLSRDILEVAALLDLAPRADRPKLRVAVQTPCSLQHGQKLVNLPGDLLRRAGFDAVDIAESHICCGSAGVYNILQSDLATRLRDRKTEALTSTGCLVAASTNIGCIMQIRSHPAALPIVHVVELLNWASGGEPPRALVGRAGMSCVEPRAEEERLEA